jgi:hypothetical protein
MLLTHAKFKEFTPNAIHDTKQSTEVLVGLSCPVKAGQRSMSWYTRRLPLAAARIPGGSSETAI